MGIRHLNRYLVDRCSKEAIGKRHLKELEKKTIVIDASIYMYKYTSQGALIEYIYLMISVFLKYKIIPIFVFDGKPPPEKRHLIKERSKFKKEAEIKYNYLKCELDKTILSDEVKKDMTEEMDSLKKKFIRIKDKDVKQIKLLLNAYGISYYEANGEADKLCAYMVQSGRAWACLSDDMDMFVYGCSRVLRHFSLFKHTVIVYDYDIILSELNLSSDAFRKIMVLSGTDYNINQNCSLYETLKLYETYIKSKNITCEFYEWLDKNTSYIDDYEGLLKTNVLFCIENISSLDELTECSHFADKNNIDLENILKEDGFVFI